LPSAEDVAPSQPAPLVAEDEPLPWDAEPVGDDMNWLQEASALESAASAAPPAPAKPVGPQEDWLADFMGESEPATSATTAESEEVAAWINEPSPAEDWLRELQGASPDQPEPRSAAGAPAQPASDDWLADFRNELATSDYPEEVQPAESATLEPWSAPEGEPLALDEDWLRGPEAEPPADLAAPEQASAPLSLELEPLPGLETGLDSGFDEAWLASFLSGTPAQTPPEAPPYMPAETLAETLAETPLELPPAFEAASQAPFETEPAAELPDLELPDLEVPDWFASVPSEATPAATSAPADDEVALDWMADLPADWQPSTGAAALLAAETRSTASAPSDEDVLDWMREPEEPASTRADEPGAPPDTEPAAIPDWMRGMAPVASGESAAPAEPEPAAGFSAELEGPLDWVGAADARDQGEPLAEAEIPAWMRDIAPAAPTPMASPVEDQETAASLDWLAQVDTGAGTPQPPAGQLPQPVSPFSLEPVDGPITESGELVMDLSSADIDALLNLPPSESEPAPVAEETSLVQMVDMDMDALDLDEILGPEEPGAEPGLMGAAAGAAAAATQPPPVELAPDAARQNLPGWIEQMQPSEVPVVIQVGDQKVRIAERPVAQLDPQLQKLRDRSRQVSAEAQKQGETPSSGPLSGISDAIIPIADQIPAATSAVAGVIIDDLEARRVRVLESLLGAQEEQMRRHLEQDQAEEAAQPDGKRARRRRRARARNRARFKFDRLVVTVFLALAVIAPFFTDALNVFAPLSFADLASEDKARIDTVGTAVDLIQPANPYALVAFEFRPTGAGEMDDLAVAVLRDVWRRGGIPVVVSTDASGAVHAQGLIARLANETATLAITNRLDRPMVARQDYVVLGFIPGGAAGVRALYDSIESDSFLRQFLLNVDIEGQPAGLDDSVWNSLRVNPVFVLAEGQDDVRNWAEQFRPRGESGQATPGGAPRLILLSSVGASAIAQTYASTDPARFGGPLIGLRGATLYAERRDLRASDEDALTAARRWQSTGLALTAAAVAVLFGAALNGIRTLRRRRTRR
jgi:hypothetical protein